MATLLDDVDAEYGFKSETESKAAGIERDKVEYLYLKMTYQKAKLLRKTR